MAESATKAGHNIHERSRLLAAGLGLAIVALLPGCASVTNDIPPIVKTSGATPPPSASATPSAGNTARDNQQRAVEAANGMEQTIVDSCASVYDDYRAGTALLIPPDDIEGLITLTRSQVGGIVVTASFTRSTDKADANGLRLGNCIATAAYRFASPEESAVFAKTLAVGREYDQVVASMDDRDFRLTQVDGLPGGPAVSGEGYDFDFGRGVSVNRPEIDERAQVEYNAAMAGLKAAVA